ncbi:DNA-directed RNA polymerases IV and V subunit 2-like [Wolffia australiana]
MIDDDTEDRLVRFRKEAGRAFLEEFGLISHQINSYNAFVENGIQRIFDSLSEVDVSSGEEALKKGSRYLRRARITFGKVRLELPTFWTEDHDSYGEPLKLLPRHARLQNLTYSARMLVEVKVEENTEEALKGEKFKAGKGEYTSTKVLNAESREILMGTVPVMVKSNLCWLHKLGKSECGFDAGGYFLIKGTEKVFIAQEQRCHSRLWTANKPSWVVQYQSPQKRKRVYVKFDSNSNHDSFTSKKFVTVNFIYALMPVWLLFFALGASSDKEIFQMINIDQSNTNLVSILLDTIKETEEKFSGFRLGAKARDFVSNLLRGTKFPPTETVDQCFKDYLFPGMEEEREKALFLGHMVKTLLLTWSGKRKCDSIHDLRNKRLELAGDLLSRQLYIHVRHAQRSMSRKIQRDLQGDRPLKDVECYVDASIVSNGLRRAFSTGQWSHPYKRMETTSGVVATLRRVNALQMMSDLRKTRQQVQYSSKSGDARYPHPSFWGKLCFLSTPDGENCGLVKNLAVTGLVSSHSEEPVLEALTSSGMESLTTIPLHVIGEMSKVFLNGTWVGSCHDGRYFAAQLRSLRRRQLIHREVEVKWDPHDREVRVFTEGGRLMRPLLIAENLDSAKDLGLANLRFQSLLDAQLAELIGAEEEEDCRPTWEVTRCDGDHTHCELDPSFLLGLGCSLTPFTNHDLARRALYQAEKHSHQAIGASTVNPLIRLDTVSYRLYYPQLPLVRTAVFDGIGRRSELYNGQAAVVAVNVHQGFNQEDSLVLSRAALDRGMFRAEVFRCYRAAGGDADGLPEVGAMLRPGDPVAGHTVRLRHTERGSVQRVVVAGDGEGGNHVAVVLRQVREAELGDKFSSMHGQKGVVGLVESQENFPFTAQGIVPDVVINPHAFPTRQTVGQLLEAALGKAIAAGAPATTATPFSAPSAEAIGEMLQRAGFSRWGAERVCCGRTGEMVKGSMVFMGPTFYQRLVHMAEDKVKFRNTGPVHPQTRQPVGERKRYGGVRFGEMERDCLLAHGAAASLRERLMELSDAAEMNVCRGCERVAEVVVRTVEGRRVRGPYCRVCKSMEEIVKVDVPYGAKLLYLELFSVGICLKFRTEPC